jgi:hypothetical protein
MQTISRRLKFIAPSRETGLQRQEIAPQVLESLETPREKLAADRAQKDLQTSGETARAAAQAAVLINGGAATAVLAYLTKDAHTPSNVLRAAAITLAAYAIGVAWGAWSMWCSSQASAEWGYRWESILDHDPVGEQQFRTSAGTLAFSS